MPKAKSKHTPGPWKAYKLDGEWFIEGGDGDIADVGFKTEDGEEADLDALFEANAHLMAAAPELLEALAFYVRICGNTAHSVTRETALEMYTKGNAALEKALGK